ncbi:MAG: hypothetical protein A3G21_21825 [Acidobacteria bacterium RIFCSPLOWO2_12_FULL_66_21]|nr:MAG: hypothetical protein A3G21_21825 [Acidobacteria bacterium RIFCSPLOWO2_12_FULL_66_21]
MIRGGDRPGALVHFAPQTVAQPPVTVFVDAAKPHLGLQSQTAFPTTTGGFVSLHSIIMWLTADKAVFWRDGFHVLSRVS